MFNIKPLFFALALAQASASNSRRSLDEEELINYMPQTVVTDQAAIDLDQMALEGQLGSGTDDGFESARKIYIDGGFSRSYAELLLDNVLGTTLVQGTEVVGTNTNGEEIKGTILAEAEAGAKVIRVQYAVSGMQESYVRCQVGANPDPVFEGCFRPTGTMKIVDGRDLPYSYEPQTDNKNARTLQRFSLEAKEAMHDCNSRRCPHKVYEKFYNYYKAYDYGDKWVQAAFDKGKADFENGSADFSSYTGPGLIEAIKKGTAYLNVWMHVNRMMEEALGQCKEKCADGECGGNGDDISKWDEAVAFYTGSIPKETGDGGYLFYTLAQKRCANFGTCVQDGVDVGMADVNSKVFQLFNQAKQHLLEGRCTDVPPFVDSITALMSVPMIQGTLRYAHIIGEQGGATEKAKAEGAAFAAAVLPILHACSASDAQLVYENMHTGSEKVSFSAVKKAFEDNYECMGEITCSDIGGLLQADGETYFDLAEPCESGDDAGDAGDDTGGAGDDTGDAGDAADNGSRESGSTDSLEMESGALEFGVGTAAGMAAFVFAAII